MEAHAADRTAEKRKGNTERMVSTSVRVPVSVEPARSMTTLGYPRFPQGDGVDSAIEALAGAERSMTGKIGPLKGHRAAGHYSLG